VRFGLEVRQGRAAVSAFARRLADQITARGGSIIREDEEPGEAPAILIAVGGDGTMLAAVQKSLVWDVPVLGFNMGTLGFLAGAEPSELATVVDRLMTGEFEVENRTTVSATVSGGHAVGINDVVVEKVDSTRLVSLSVAIDGIPFVTYQADGLIVATPTGSTAYSFSARGPLIDPRVSALVMTPVASHSLFDRPIVLPGETVLEVVVSRDRRVKVNVDKTSLGELAEGESVLIRQGERPARFVRFDSLAFPGLVKEKFGLE
jgi:NAD+ kinase